MTRPWLSCLIALLLATTACTATGGGKDRGRHRTGPPQAPHHYAHWHDRLRNRMLFAAGVMAACGRRHDARRASWNAAVANKRPRRPGRWSKRRLGKALRRSTDAAVRRQVDGYLRCRSSEVARLSRRIGKTHSRLRSSYPNIPPPGRVARRPPDRSGSEPPRRRDRERDDSRRRRDRDS